MDTSTSIISNVCCMQFQNVEILHEVEGKTNVKRA